MNPEQPKPCLSQASALQALSLCNIAEAMEHIVERAQEIQQKLAQRSSSLEKELAKAQTLQGREALVADKIKVEMAHQTQLSVLSQLYLCQAKEIKSQTN